MGTTKPTFRTSESTNARIRTLLAEVIAKRAGKRVRSDDLLDALAQLGDRHMPELLDLLAEPAK